MNDLETLKVYLDEKLGEQLFEQLGTKAVQLIQDAGFEIKPPTIKR